MMPGIHFSPSEQAVIDGLAVGLSVTDIARERDISPKTVSTMIHRIREKIEDRTGQAIYSTNQLILWAVGKLPREEK